MMTVQPSAFSASVAGTQRAITRSGDAEHAQAQAASRQARAENPGGQHGGVEQIERDAATGDSGADGRQLLSGQNCRGEPEHTQEEDRDASPHSVSKEGAGQSIDFDA